MPRPAAPPEQALDSAGTDVGASPDDRSHHARLGVGARFSLHPATDRFVEVVLGALEAARTAVPEVGVRTDDVSTLVRGSERDVARFLTAAVAHAAAATPTGHLVASVMLSRGCPGEVGCTLPAGELPTVPPVDLPATGLRAAAHWALYPLGTPDEMAPIEDAIARAGERGTLSRPEHFVTRLDGDLADVLATVVDTWAAVGSHVAHVTTHATISLGSPTTTTTVTSTATEVAR